MTKSSNPLRNERELPHVSLHTTTHVSPCPCPRVRSPTLPLSVSNITLLHVSSFRPIFVILMSLYHYRFTMTTYTFTKHSNNCIYLRTDQVLDEIHVVVLVTVNAVVPLVQLYSQSRPTASLWPRRSPSSSPRSASSSSNSSGCMKVMPVPHLEIQKVVPVVFVGPLPSIPCN